MKRFYTYKDVADIIGVGETKAYKIIKNLNKKLNSKGYNQLVAKYPMILWGESLYCRYT
jgi:DNA-binding CsgD family transcriptional regulator